MKEKRIIVRVDLQKWRELDDKRHAERTSFQDVGVRLFHLWLHADEASKSSGNSDSDQEIIRDKVNEFKTISEADQPWVNALIAILTSGNDVAIRALKSNILAFSDYVRAVPEVPDGFADIAAESRRLAALDERMVDAIAAATVGSNHRPQKARRETPGKIVRKRV